MLGIDSLRSEIRNLVSACCGDAEHAAAVIQALTRPCYALNTESRCSAGLFALAVSRAVSIETAAASLRAGAAVELLFEASFFFDDVADDEVDSTLDCGRDGVIALGLTVLNCAYSAASDLARVRGSSVPWHAVRGFQQGTALACSGHYLDAAFRRKVAPSPERSLQMTLLKAGGLGQAAGLLASGAVTDNPRTVRLFGELGRFWFCHAQLGDDLRDAFSGAVSDFARGKKTLPTVYCSSTRGLRVRGQAGGTIHNEGAPTDLSKTGALLYGAILAETFLNRTKELLRSLRCSGFAVEELEELVGSSSSYRGSAESASG